MSEWFLSEKTIMLYCVMLCRQAAWCILSSTKQQAFLNIVPRPKRNEKCEGRIFTRGGVCATINWVCVCVCVWKYIKTQGKSLLTDLLHSSCLRLWIMFSLPLIDEFHPLNVLFMLFFHFLNFTHDLRISHFILDFEKWSNWVSGGLCLILKLKRRLLF